jgi:hypothetical protein
MREAAFVKQNKDKWLRFESVLKNNIQISPDELSALYIEITDYLSFAQTFYPKSSTHTFLNNLAILAHQKIYKTKRESRTRFITFYTEEFPLFFKSYHKQLLISFITFTLFCVIGAFSAATDGDFVRLILGDGYVNMTLDNIEKEDPMAVYKDKVGLIEFSNKINTILPAQAKRTYLSTILNALYNVDTNFLDSDYGLLQATIKRSVNQRSLIMLYTNFEHITSLHRQINYLKAIARQHVLVVIFFENTELSRLAEMNIKNKADIFDQTIAQQFQYDKKLIVKELNQKGIQTILTPPENLTINTINKYLEIKAKGLL